MLATIAEFNERSPKIYRNGILHSKLKIRIRKNITGYNLHSRS